MGVAEIGHPGGLLAVQEFGNIWAAPKLKRRPLDGHREPRRLAILIAYPALALIPSAIFLALFAAARRRVILVAGAGWALYAAYEFAMKLRWLCTGECNIRVDLLALYPALLVLSAVAGLAAFRARSGKRRPSP